MTDKLEIGRYDMGSAESSPAFLTNGVIYAYLNVDGTLPLCSLQGTVNQSTQERHQDFDGLLQ